MKYLLMGIAAAALAATGAGAGPGNGPGKGKEKAEQARVANAGDNRAGPPGRAGEKNRSGPSTQAALKEKRGQGQPQQARAAGNGGGNPSADRGNDRGGPPVPAMRRDDRAGPSGEVGRRDGRMRDDGFRVYETRETRRWLFDDDRQRLITGCPPGLAKKRNGCMPPGLAKQDDRRMRFADFRPDWWGLSRLDGGRYFYEDGYLLRYDGNRILGYVPLLGGALAIGNPWPSYYDPRPVPDYYVNYFGLGPASGYRYADNVLYRVDPDTAAITSIAALLTGDDIRVGQPMPMGYDVYNVPYPYRSRFADGPDARYRYSDGYVYQIDPETRLVAAAIELLAS